MYSLLSPAVPPPYGPPLAAGIEKYQLLQEYFTRRGYDLRNSAWNDFNTSVI